MGMKKRFLIFITAFYVMLTRCAMLLPIYADGVEVDANAVALLRSLDIMYAAEDDYEKSISRADFAVAIGNIFNIDQYSKTEESYFSDVPSDHWAAGSINALVNMGIISKDTGFRPEDVITGAEACKLLMSAAGYDAYAQQKGGFPTGYYRAANNTGIMDGIAGDESLTTGDAINMLFKILSVDIYDTVTFGSDRYVYAVAEGTTLLSLYKGIYVAEGQLTAVDLVSLGGDKGERGKLRVDDVSYSMDEEIDGYELLGEKVHIYYSDDKKGDCGKTVMLIPQTKQNNVVCLTVDKTFKYDEVKGTVEYLPDERTRWKSLTVADNAYIMKNGMDCSDNVAGTLQNINKGSVRLVDYNGDNKYDIVCAAEYFNLTVGYIDKDEMTVYDKYDKKKSVSLEDDSEKRVRIMSYDKKSMSFDAIKKNDLITVYDSDVYAEVYVCGNSFTGTIEKITESDDCVLTVDGVSYIVDKDYAADENVAFFPGDKREFKLDYAGRIAYASGIAEGLGNYGYIVAYTNNYGAIEPTLKLKIYSPENGMVLYDCAERVAVDGTSQKGYDLILAALKNYKSSVSGQLIGYSLNDNGEISEIDTAYVSEKEDNNSLRINAAASTQRYYYETKMFGYKTIVNSSTVIMAVPNDDALSSASDKNFSVLPINNFTDGESYTVESYKLSEDEGYTRYLIAKGDMNDTFTRPSDMLVVSSLYTGLDIDGDTVEMIEGYSAGVKLELQLSDKTVLDEKGVKEGDLIRYTLDARGRIIDIEMLYSYTPELIPPSWAPRTSSYTNSINVTHGYVDTITDDNVIKLRFAGSSGVSEIGSLKNINAVVVYDPDRRGEHVYVGNKDELVSADDAGADGSMVFIRTRYGAMQWIALYK